MKVTPKQLIIVKNDVTGHQQDVVPDLFYHDKSHPQMRCFTYGWLRALQDIPFAEVCCTGAVFPLHFVPQP